MATSRIVGQEWGRPRGETGFDEQPRVQLGVIKGRETQVSVFLAYTVRPWSLPVDAFTLFIAEGPTLLGATGRAFADELGPTKLESDFLPSAQDAASGDPPLTEGHHVLLKMHESLLEKPMRVFLAMGFADPVHVAIDASQEGIRRLAITLERGGEEEPIKAATRFLLSLSWKISDEDAPPIKLRELTLTTNSRELWRSARLLASGAWRAPDRLWHEGERAPPARRAPQAEWALFFDNDQPLKEQPKEKREDCLKLREQARTFARLIASEQAVPPLSVGLFGDWGTGKTFFMQMIKEEIDSIQREAAHDGRGTYVGRVAQLWFNAWHYADTNLWASLATRIFDGLAEQFTGRRNRGAYEQTRRELRVQIDSSQRLKEEAQQRQQHALSERKEAADQLAQFQAQRARSARGYGRQLLERLLKQNASSAQKLSEVRRAAEELGLSPVVETAEDAARLGQQLRVLDGQLHGILAAVGTRFSGGRRTAVSFFVLLLFLALVIVIPVVVGRLRGAEVVAGLLQVCTVIGGAVAWVGRRMNALRCGLSSAQWIQQQVEMLEPTREADSPESRCLQEIESADARIQQAMAQMQQAEHQLAEAQAELQRINAGGLIYDFLGGRLQDERYLHSLGLISTIRQDFEELGELLKDWQRGPESSRPFKRIVLYIDDLDRCHPDRVVEVLQAVHLLLALDLFVVVVGVDARWLERSLHKIYAPEGSGPGTGPDTGEFSPQNYLEKIFQVPFCLPPMSASGFKRLIRFLATSPAPSPLQHEAEREGTSSEPQAQDASVKTELVVRDAQHDETRSDEPPEPPEPPGQEEEGEDLLRLSRWEMKYLQEMHAFIPTPRLAKRLLNIYRLLRARAAGGSFDFSRFIDPVEGDYRAVQLLLALNVGHPRIGGRLLSLLYEGGGIVSWPQLQQQLSPEHSWARANFPEEQWDELDAICQELARLSRDPGLLSPIDPYVRWAPEVARYSFHWNLTRSGAPQDQARTSMLS